MYMVYIVCRENSAFVKTKGITSGKIGRLRNQVRDVLKNKLAETDGTGGMMKK